MSWRIRRKALSLCRICQSLTWAFFTHRIKIYIRNILCITPQFCQFSFHNYFKKSISLILIQLIFQRNIWMSVEPSFFFFYNNVINMKYVVLPMTLVWNKLASKTFTHSFTHSLTHSHGYRCTGEMLEHQIIMSGAVTFYLGAGQLPLSRVGKHLKLPCFFKAHEHLSLFWSNTSLIQWSD